jgi:hypothetical protein
MSTRAAFLFAAGCLTLFVRGASGQERAVPPAYANVEVVSIDPSTRLVVIKNSKGAQETFELDDLLAGVPGVKSGDHVMMTVRGEPGRKRISAITKVGASPAPASSNSSAATSPPKNPDPARDEMRERYADKVANLSQQARATDVLWSSFVTSCDAKQTSSAEGSRDWFGLWDARVKADLSSGFCRDLFNQIVSSGEGVKKAMGAADDVARKTLEAGEMRDIRKLNSMDWEGWTLPAPDKLAP